MRGNRPQRQRGAHMTFRFLNEWFCLIIVVFTPHDERSQGEHPHNSLRSRDCTYKLIKVDDKMVSNE